MQIATLAIIWASIVPLLASCTIAPRNHENARSAIEQLLLAQALNRSLLDVALPLSLREPLYMEVSGLQLGYMSPLCRCHLCHPRRRIHITITPSDEGYFSPAGDLAFISDAVASHLGVLGYRLAKREDDAPIWCGWSCNRLAPSNRSHFSACRPIQSVLIPFSLPQLTIYQTSCPGWLCELWSPGRRTGLRSTGSIRLPWHSHRTYHDQYTFFFFFTFRDHRFGGGPLMHLNMWTPIIQYFRTLAGHQCARAIPSRQKGDPPCLLRCLRCV